MTGPVDTFARDNLPPRERWPELRIAPLGYPDELNCAVALLDGAVAAGHGWRTAFSSEAETLTYDQLADRVARIAAVLADDLGFVTGNRVLLRAPNTPMLVACWLAVARAGGVVVATMPLLRRRELAHIVAHSAIGIALCDDRLTDELDGLCDRLCGFGELMERAASKPADRPPVATASDDVVLIAYTSGTTGKPKATMHFHRDILAICDTFGAAMVRATPADVFIGTPPIAFTFGLGGLVLFPMRVGASGALLEKSAPEALLEGIERFGATMTFTAPTAYRRLLAAGDGTRLRTLRRCVSAGETLPLPVFQHWRQETGISIVDGIGATEMLHIFISAGEDDIRPGTTGKPVPGYEARVVGDDMQTLSPGSIGRLAVRGPTGCRYLADERQRDYVVDGWNVTGDSYHVDEDGYFHYCARTDDMIVTGGYNISGPEVEEVLLEHAAVVECAVVAAPDEARGTVVKAYIVAADGVVATDVLARELQDFVKARIAPYKYPRAVEFLAVLPRTETGKLQRFALREREG